MRKKALTLIEVVIVIMIIGIVAVLLIQTLKPNKFEEKTDLAHSRKVIETIQSAIVQMLDMEKGQCPTRSFMIKSAGTNEYEFSVLNPAKNSSATATQIVELMGNYLKFQTGAINFCDNTSYCDSDNIIGAKMIDGAVFGIEKFDNVQNCPSYRLPGEEADSPMPTRFNPSTSADEAIKCWGKLYIDVNAQKGADTYGSDVFEFGLGEFGIVK